jgi:kynurenine formamidase
MTQRWKQRPAGSNWGDFGADDELGSLNYITPARVLGAVAEVREGRTFCLSLPLDYPGGRVLAPHRHPPVLHSTERRGQRYFNYSFAQEGPTFRDVGCDDAVTLCTQYSTQWDGFAHIGHAFDADADGVDELCYYNGFRAGEHIRSPEDRVGHYAMPLGIDAFAARPIQGRGVLVNLEHHYGRGARLVSFADIAAVLEADAIAIEPGDIVCFHTGFADEILKMGGAPDASRVQQMCCALDGADEALLTWLSGRQVAAVVADNYAVERIAHAPDSGATAFVPLHYHCLFTRGIPLGELWYLTDLAHWLRSNGRNYFLLTAPPLRLPGAVGSPVTPVATV